MQKLQKLGIIAGNGVYPRILAEAARSAGVNRIYGIAFTGETVPALADCLDEIRWVRVGQLHRMLSTFREWQITDAIMAGQIAPPNLFNLHPDWRALLLLAKLKQRNAATIFSAIGAELEKIGVNLLPAYTFLEDLLAPEGLIAGPKLSRRDKEDVEFGVNIARQIALLDIGQTIVVKNGTVLAVEAFEGTDETIRRGGALARADAVIIKVSKPAQDMRFDVPVIGPETIRVAAKAGIRVIAVEAARTLLLEKGALVETAGDARISLVGC